MDRKGLIEVFERLDDALAAPATLCVIGASAILGYGHPSRQTDDIDVWRPASEINDRHLSRAASAAGIEIDRGTDHPEGVYVQIIEPGVVQLPDYERGVWATGERKITLWTGEKLVVEAPPPAIVAAAKLVRADERDIDDCVYLLRAKGLSMASISHAIAKLNDPVARDAASGNITILKVVADPGLPSKSRGLGDNGDRQP